MSATGYAYLEGFARVFESQVLQLIWNDQLANSVDFQQPAKFT